MSKKRLILIRHAHRETDAGRSRDNGLSDRGKEQAKQFRDEYLAAKYPLNALFFSSPKKRCVETVEPLARKAVQAIEIDKLLDEQSDGESNFALTRRVQLFIAWVEQAEAQTIVACSHGDWIPLFCELAVNEPRDFRKGEWLAFEISDKGKWSIL